MGIIKRDVNKSLVFVMISSIEWQAMLFKNTLEFKITTLNIIIWYYMLIRSILRE